MRFKKLRISGFKSFVEPADFVIEKGLTGIVGPNGCGKSNLIEALRWAEATVVVPFKYSQLLWALMFGFLIWSQVPNASVAAGATLVIGSGLYIWNRESRLAKT